MKPFTVLIWEGKAPPELLEEGRALLSERITGPVVEVCDNGSQRFVGLDECLKPSDADEEVWYATPTELCRDAWVDGEVKHYVYRSATGEGLGKTALQAYGFREAVGA